MKAGHAASEVTSRPATEQPADEPPPPPSSESVSPPPPAEQEAEPPPATGGVSLWHKIFGSPEQQAQKIIEAEPTAESASGDRDQGQEQAPAKQSPAAPSEADRRRPRAPAAEAAPRREPIAGRSAEHVGDESPADESETKPRRGRRRRRGRGRKSETASSAAADAEARGRRPSSRDTKTSPRKGRPSARDDQATDPDIEFDDDLEEVEVVDTELDEDESTKPATRRKKSSGREAASAGHRNIPTWEDAIGLIVETNSQSRSERRRSSPQKSARGSSSSPRRGRRKRKP